MPRSRSDTTDAVRQTLILGLLALTMVFAPLIRAGQPPLALMGIQLLAVALIGAALWQRPALRWGEVIGLALLALVPLLYLVPLPAGLAGALPGRGIYWDVWTKSLGEDGLPGMAHLSLIPSRTFAAWLVVLIPIGVFLAVRSLDPKRLPVLVYLLLGIAALQSVLGLIQFGAGPDSPFYLGMEHTHFGSAVGTYTNRNHLAAFIAMTLPLALALLFFNAGRGRDRRRGARARAAFLSTVRGQQALVFAALVVLMLIALIFSRSRAGIALTMLGILLSVAVFSRRIGGDNVFGPTGSLVAIALGLAVAIGLVPVLDRFSVENVVDDARWEIFGSTLAGIGTFFPVGSGPGTYQEVYPVFQPLDLGRWFINRAHNDYLEWVFEGGVAAVVLIGWLLVLYVMRWPRVWSAGEWSRLRFLQVGSGVGIFLILLHELVEYNLHTPANLIFFAVLVGIFFSEPDAEVTAGHRTKRRTPVLGEEPAEAAYAPVVPSKPAPDQIKNPFLED